MLLVCLEIDAAKHVALLPTRASAAPGRIGLNFRPFASMAGFIFFALIAGVEQSPDGTSEGGVVCLGRRHYGPDFFDAAGEPWPNSE